MVRMGIWGCGREVDREEERARLTDEAGILREG